MLINLKQTVVCEMTNLTLKQKLFSSGLEHQWNQRLNLAVHWMNTCEGSSTKASPFAIETGFNGENIHDPVENQSSCRLDVRELSKNTHEMIIAEKKCENFSTANLDSVFSGNVKSLRWKNFFVEKMCAFVIWEIFDCIKRSHKNILDRMLM